MNLESVRFAYPILYASLMFPPSSSLKINHRPALVNNGSHKTKWVRQPAARENPNHFPRKKEEKNNGQKYIYIQWVVFSSAKPTGNLQSFSFLFLCSVLLLETMQAHKGGEFYDPDAPPFWAASLWLTFARWPENFKCASNFWAVMSGPGVYSLVAQSRQRMRGSQAYLTPSGNGCVCGWRGSSVSGSRYEYFMMASNLSPLGYCFSRSLRALTSHSGGGG